MRVYHGDKPTALTKTKELAVHALLQTHQLAFDYQVHVPFASCGLGSDTKYAFLDFVLPKPWGKVILEVDEQQHYTYPPHCDVRRDFDILASIALGSDDKLVMLRYNPDPFKVAGMSQVMTKKDREAKLLQTLQDLEQEPPLHFTRFFLFYDRPTEHSILPSVAQGWSDEVKQLSRCIL